MQRNMDDTSEHGKKRDQTERKEITLLRMMMTHTHAYAMILKLVSKWYWYDMMIVCVAVLGNEYTIFSVYLSAKDLHSLLLCIGQVNLGVRVVVLCWWINPLQ